MAPTQINVESLVTALRDPRVTDALAQVLIPSLQTVITSAVNSAIEDLKNCVAQQTVTINEQKSCIDQLKAEKDKLAERLYDLEVYSRIDNLVVHGIPENYAETVTDGVTQNNVEYNSNAEVQFIKFCNDKLNITVSKSDISTAHRLPRKSGSSGPKPLIVRFTNRRIRSLILKKKRQLKSDTSGRYFINEHLSPEANDIFEATRNLYKSKKIASTWTFNGHVYLKRLEDGPNAKPILIRLRSQLADF